MIALQGDPSGADHFENAERPHQFDKRFQLALLAGDFDHDVGRADIHDPASKNFDQLFDLGSTVVGKRLDAKALRAIALQRWPYAPWLVHDEQVRLLREACREMQRWGRNS